ncbi:hypothetical protein QTG56_24040 (plasmid) [Rossellomorea sp. AcN35-11]|nr:hypothetical protein [Rossellomorea aquimaris]WJV31710.1 hypothetical protein QTG56_24040 [Rossellomorea sp. AcN35-11]
MNVYLVDIDNGLEYSDADHQVEGVHKTFRGASEHLLQKGFNVYPIKNIKDRYELTFEKYERDKDKPIEGVIIEFPLQE